MNGLDLGIVGLIRDVREGDLSQMLEWRNAPKVRENMYSQHEITLTEHLAWWEKIKLSQTDRYFIFELNSKPLGVVAFNDIDVLNNTAFWAFYSSPEAPRGTGSRMETLALEYCFSFLGLHKLCCEVLEFNKAVVRLHKKFGFVEEGFFRDQRRIGSQYVGVYRLAIVSSQWAALRSRFISMFDPEIEK
mgnify:CR=1 FL=1